jgi:hypothetical protein
VTAPVTTASSASKRVAKAVRSGKGTKTKTRKLGDGPEAELSDEEDVVVYPLDGGEDGETTPEPEERALGERVVEGVSGKSVPKNEINMGMLIAGAKPRPGESKRAPWPRSASSSTHSGNLPYDGP